MESPDAWVYSRAMRLDGDVIRFTAAEELAFGVDYDALHADQAVENLHEMGRLCGEAAAFLRELAARSE